LLCSISAKTDGHTIAFQLFNKKYLSFAKKYRQHVNKMRPILSIKIIRSAASNGLSTTSTGAYMNVLAEYAGWEGKIIITG